MRGGRRAGDFPFQCLKLCSGTARPGTDAGYPYSESREGPMIIAIALRITFRFVYEAGASLAGISCFFIGKMNKYRNQPGSETTK
jgi:hypothetical protein